MESVDIIGTNVTACSMEEQLQSIKSLVNKKCSSYITYTNVHVVVISKKDERLQQALKGAHIVSPDGMPLVWIAKRKGFCRIERCSGPDMMASILEMSCKNGLTNYFYGSTQETLDKLKKNLMERFDGIKIVGTFSPPFRHLSDEEKHAIAQEINDLSPDLIWVGLGAPKQEYWMNEFSERLDRGVMLGVGAAFDFHAGLQKRAPAGVQRYGLEWLYRLLSEPGRLGKRYLTTNSLFLYYLFKDSIIKQLNGYKGGD